MPRSTAESHFVPQMREALIKHRADQCHTVVQSELKKARSILLDIIVCRRMRAKLAWSAPHKKKASVEVTLPQHVEAKAYALPGGRIVWVVIVHPLPGESSSRVLRTQDARSIVASVESCPVAKKNVVALYSLSATADESRWCTPVSHKLLEARVAPFIVPCTVEDMLFDITEHVLCPPSRRLEKKEIDDLCRRLRCPDSHAERTRVFPHIQSTDPICKMCGYFVGDVVMFDRRTHVYWRVVVSS